MRVSAQRLLTGLLLGGLLFVGLPARGLAHGALRGSIPAAGARLDTTLTSLSLTFTEVIEARFFRLEIRDSAGVRLARPSLQFSADRRTVRVSDAVVASLRGPIDVRWTIIGADGHPVSGSVSFRVDAPPPRVPAPVGERVTAVDDAALERAPAWGRVDGPVATVIRWLIYVALLAIIGAWVAMAFILPKGSDQTGSGIATLTHATWRLGTIATLVLAAGLVLRVLAQGSALGVSGLSGMRDILTATNIGRGGILALLGTALAHVGFHRRGGAALPLATASGLIVIGVAMMGHAMAASSPPLAVTVVAIHVIGVAVWIGALGWLVILALPALGADGPRRAAVVRRFSAAALVATGLVGLSGIANAWRLVGSVEALTGTVYGRTLLAKMACLSVVALTGFYNWRIVLPRVAEGGWGARLRRTASIEVVIALVVLAITARLVAVAAPGLERP